MHSCPRPAHRRYSIPERERKAMDRRLACIGLLVGILVAVAQTGLKADEPKTAVMWRFDGGGRFPDIHPPSEWGRDKNILWKTPVEIGGYSSPIVVKDKVFVTAEMGSLYC